MNKTSKAHYDRLHHNMQAMTKEEFFQHPIQDRRRIVACDAWCLVNRNIVQATRGQYVSMIKNKREISAYAVENFSLLDKQFNTDTVKKNKLSCYGCAKGALFLGSAIAIDNCTIENAIRFTYGDSARFRGIFTQNQLNIIESYFELHTSVLNPKRTSYLVLWRDSVRNMTPKKYLSIILENIIEHGELKEAALVETAVRASKRQKVIA